MDLHQIRSLSFEDSYSKLEEVIERLEAGALNLEESVALYEEGMQLAENCGRHLDDAELRVTRLLSAAADQIDEQPFDPS
ncbi:MAG: exodeoxyribonuclease VII small subunit [Anaerolineae bacterium]|nr:exodeoxyribonuclease VII small subunit [Anaerolineae bacterium]